MFCRRGGRVVEGGGLENRCGRKPTGGSNPSLSAWQRRGVAQMASAPALGAGGREFESPHPDGLKPLMSQSQRLFYFGFGI